MIVKTIIKKYIRDNGLNSSGDLFEGIDQDIKRKVDDAIERCTQNKRKTVLARDY